MSITPLPSVDDMAARIEALLERARAWKPTRSIDPPLPAVEFSGGNGLPNDSKENGQLHNARIEAASRGIFHRIAVSDFSSRTGRI